MTSHDPMKPFAPVTHTGPPFLLLLLLLLEEDLSDWFIVDFCNYTDQLLLLFFVYIFIIIIIFRLFAREVLQEK